MHAPCIPGAPDGVCFGNKSVSVSCSITVVLHLLQFHGKKTDNVYFIPNRVKGQEMRNLVPNLAFQLLCSDCVYTKQEERDVRGAQDTDLHVSRRAG